MELIDLYSHPVVNKYDHPNMTEEDKEILACVIHAGKTLIQAQLTSCEQQVGDIKRQVAEKITSEFDYIIQKGAPDMGNTPRLFTVQSPKYDKLKAELKAKYNL